MTAGLRLRRPAAPIVALLGGLGWTADAVAQTLGRGADSAIDLPRVLASLALCLLLAGLAAWLLRRRQMGGAGRAPTPLSLSALGAAWLRPSATGRIKLVERMRLSPYLEVCLISCDGREVLLAATPTGGFVITPPPGEAS